MSNQLDIINYLPLIKSIISKLRYNNNDIEDYQQEAYLSIIKCQKKFNGRTKFSTYIYKVINRDIIRYISKNNKYLSIRKNRVEFLNLDIFDSLSFIERDIIIYKHIYNYTFNEISLIKNISKTSIYNIYKKAKQKIYNDYSV